MNISGLIQKVFNDVVTAYQYANIARYIQNLFLSIVMVKFGLSMEDIGTFELILFTITIFSQFWISGQRDAMVTAYDKSLQKQDVLIFGFLISVFLGMLTSGLLFLFKNHFFYINAKVLPTDLILLACIYLIFQSLSNIPETLFLLIKKAKILFWYASVFSVMYMMVIGYFLWFFPDIKVLLLVLIGLSVLKMVFGSIFLFKNSFQFSLSSFFDFLKYSFPFFLIALTGIAMDMIDGLFVRFYFDAETFAVYKYGAREFPLSSLLMNSLSIAMIPLVSLAGDLSVLKDKATKHMHLLFPVSILFIWLSKPVFTHLYNEDFTQSALIFTIYLLILGSRLLLPHTVLLARGKQKWVFWIGILEIVINIILSYWWVKVIGLEGLIWATVAAYYLHKWMMFLVISRYFKISMKDLIDVSWWIFYQILAILSFFLSKFWL
ncbi:MAG: polysaccharide biosynthesis C-terminal domain-containing protein [Saprospiraceae bacterium]|nr:polysaccharide biosynthesis C-terminal domain-containing protein [Saprospiraceae bacterium]